MSDRLYDCIIIGAGPGGLQAAIYLGRYNRDVVLLDRSGGRTWHAKHIENVVGHRDIAGSEIIALGKEQAKRFNVRVEREPVKAVQKNGEFVVSTTDRAYRSRFVIAASGVTDVLPPLANVHRFLGISYFTCVDCDGYKTTDRKLIVIGNSLQVVNLAIAMKQMYTRDITFIPCEFTLPAAAIEVLGDEAIRVVVEEPAAIIGTEKMEAIELKGGKRIPCEVIMASFGITLNDGYLKGLALKKDAAGFKYAVSGAYESSLRGLYIVGPLNTGQDQVAIAAGEGAVAAIDINKRLLEEYDLR